MLTGRACRHLLHVELLLHLINHLLLPKHLLVHLVLLFRSHCCKEVERTALRLRQGCSKILLRNLMRNRWCLLLHFNRCIILSWSGSLLHCLDFLNINYRLTLLFLRFNWVLLFGIALISLGRGLPRSLFPLLFGLFLLHFNHFFLCCILWLPYHLLFLLRLLLPFLLWLNFCLGALSRRRLFRLLNLLWLRLLYLALFLSSVADSWCRFSSGLSFLFWNFLNLLILRFLLSNCLFQLISEFFLSFLLF